MSSSKILSLSAAALWAVLAPSAFAQTTATTTPVGFITVTIPPAPSATQPSLTALAVPLYKTPDFQGAVQSIDSSNQFTLTGATLATVTTPRLARIKAGAQVGKFFLISSNTATQVTVDLTGTGVANINSVLAVNDSVEVVPANTIGGVFGTAASPPTLLPGVTSNDGDNVLLFNGVGWDTYFWTGTVGTPNNIWKRSGNIDRSNVVIYPDDGVFIVHRDPAITPVVAVTLMGTVPSTAEQSVVSSQTFLGNRFPTDTTLGALGLQNLPGWVAGASSNSSDNVLILNVSGGWDTYFWTGTVGTPNNIWKRSGNTDRSNTPIPAGTAVFVTHGGADATLAQILPYTP